jgi:Tol biopolymer transport system component
VVDGLIAGSIGPVAAGYNQFAVSDHGALIYNDDPNTTAPVSQIVSVDQQGAFTSLVETPRRFWNPRWSPRGDRLAVAIYDEQRWDLWTHDVSRETLTRLTFSGRVTMRPVWSPDGTRLFEGTRSLDPNGGDEPMLLLSSPYVTIAASVSPDGDMLVYRQSRPETGWDIVFQRVSNGDDVEIYLDTPFDELHPGLSPDGRYLTYTSNESGRIEVFVDTFPHRSSKVQISNEGGTEPVWSPDGSELFYRNENAMMRVSVTTEPEFAPSKPSLLFEGEYLLDFIRQTANYDVSPDGEKFVMLRGIEGTRGSQIAVVLNWFDELKRLVPTQVSSEPR